MEFHDPEGTGAQEGLAQGRAEVNGIQVTALDGRYRTITWLTVWVSEPVLPVNAVSPG